jgi:uridine kinase
MFDFIKGYKKVVCPFCFDKFYLKDIHFRCSADPSVCNPEVDPILALKWNENTPIGKSFKLIGHYTKKAPCPSCKIYSNVRLCPHCHSILPKTIGNYRNLIVAIIGARECGKSHYLAMLIHQLRNITSIHTNNLHIYAEAIDEETLSRYKNDFYNPIFNHNRIIIQTESAITNTTVKRPLVYSLLIERKIFNIIPIRDIITLILFDTAGEDLNTINTMKLVNKYICSSDGIILLIDPLQLQQVRLKISPSTPIPQINTETTDIITRTTRLIQETLQLDEHRLINIPIAVSFTKFDAIEQLLPNDHPYYSIPNHNEGFNLSDFHSINNEISSLLDDWGCNYIIQQITKSYRHNGFFALTALGCNPHSTQVINNIKPTRVLEPLLWILAENKLIKKIQ